MSRPEPSLARDAPFPAATAAYPSRVAYLVNRYAAVSHSLIRREIAGLEWRGLVNRLYSIRRQDGDLQHPAVGRVLALTQAALAQIEWALIAKASRQAAVIPVRFARCPSRALGMTLGKHREVRAATYVVEACWLAGALRRKGIKHLHAHFGTNPTALARSAADIAGILYSFTVHGPDRQRAIMGEVAYPRIHQFHDAEPLQTLFSTAAANSYGVGGT